MDQGYGETGMPTYLNQLHDLQQQKMENQAKQLRKANKNLLSP